MFSIATRGTLRARSYSKTIRRFFSTRMDGGNPRVVVEIRGKTAVVRMQHGENRIVPEFVRDFNAALDEIEKLARHLLASDRFWHCAYVYLLYSGTRTWRRSSQREKASSSPMDWISRAWFLPARSLKRFYQTPCACLQGCSHSLRSPLQL